MKKKIKKFIPILAILLILLSSKAYSDDSSTRSIIGDWFNKVFSIELTDGSTLLDTSEDKRIRENINLQIYDGNSKQDYSLYDRFGGNIQFVPYFGETKIKTTLADRFYSAYLKNDAHFKLNMETIKSLLNSPAVSNNVIYKTRPDILSADQLEGGYIDPRVTTYDAVSTTGGNASVGNLLLSISGFITFATSWISSSKLFTTVNDIFTWTLSNGFSEILNKISSIFVPLGIIIGVLMLVSKAFQVFKGNFAAGKFFSTVINCVISLGLIFALVEKPAAFSSIFTSAVSMVDTVFDQGLNVATDEVINSSSLRNVRAATLWKKAVFEPWCNGMFQNDYEKMYTMYDNSSTHTKFKQSDDYIDASWDGEEPRFNSKNITGDITVPLSQDKNVRNWAALAWSCQSIYHINTTSDDDKSEGDGIWPKATTCPYNTRIYIDNFRWLDAKLNISPEYYNTDHIVMNYSKSKPYKETFVSQGFRSIYMCLLLIPIIVLSVRKMKYILFIVLGGVRLWYYSMMSFFMPSEYDFLSNIKKLISPLYDYFWWSMAVYISITTYYVFAGDNLIKDFIYIIFGIYICKLKPIKTISQLRGIKMNAKRFVNSKLSKMVGSLDARLKK